MLPNVFSTEGIAPAQQFDAWREWFLPVLDVRRPPESHGEFRATNRVWNLGTLLVSSVFAPPVAVARSRGNIAKAPVDHWVISFCKQGETTIQTNDALLKAPAGVPYVWSLGDKSESERSQTERIQLHVPRDLFQGIAPVLDAARGTTINTALGAILGEYMLTLERWLPSVSPSDLPRFESAVCGVLAACLAPSADRMAQASRDLNDFRIERVRQIVRTNLMSPQLRPEMICKEAGLSRSSLYRLFEADGGIVRYIQRQRLLRAYDLLSDPENRASIVTISDGLCFADASSFSRAFKLEFNCSPRDVRSATLQGLPTLEERSRPAPSSAPRFADYLRHT